MILNLYISISTQILVEILKKFKYLLIYLLIKKKHIFLLIKSYSSILLDIEDAQYSYFINELILIKNLN
jgi:hypothetical protein